YLLQLPHTDTQSQRTARFNYHPFDSCSREHTVQSIRLWLPLQKRLGVPNSSDFGIVFVDCGLHSLTIPNGRFGNVIRLRSANLVIANNIGLHVIQNFNNRPVNRILGRTKTNGTHCWLPHSRREVLVSCPCRAVPKRSNL